MINNSRQNIDYRRQVTPKKGDHLHPEKILKRPLLPKLFLKFLLTCEYVLLLSFKHLCSSRLAFLIRKSGDNIDQKEK